MSNEAKSTGGRGRRKPVTKVQETETVGVLQKPVPKVFNPLVPKKVYVRPIKRKDSWLPETHEANFLYGDAYFELCAPVDKVTGNIIQPLTRQEVEFFEDISLSHIHGLGYNKGDLSPVRKTDNVWHTYSGEFWLKLKNETKVLELDKAEHYILWRMLLANKVLIAPDGEAGEPGHYRHKGTFKFKLEEEGFEAYKNASASDKLMDAWIEVGKLQTSRDHMVTLLNLAYPGKRFPYESNIEEFKSEIKKLVETEVDKFLSIVTDPLFESKSFIYKAIRYGFIVNENNNIHSEGGDHFFGKNIKEAAEFISYPENQGVMIEISKKIKATE